ncbi:P63C domain-containing protein [Trinickia dinghuensis]|uniref:P63C domain-containing protein n=1 Tax=Trinickia dinghuensis TaxID=2291023 RepID=UPI001FE4A7D4|nr:P63C domain-containing protein [Trinickia dinghuensis]
MAETNRKAKGGKAAAAKLTPEQRTQRAKKAVAAREAKKALPVATHGSVDHPIRIGDIEIPCYVLADGTRVLAQRGVQESLGMSSTGGSGLARFTSSKALSPFINKELSAALESPIQFTTPRGGSPTYGYPATVLPDLVDAVLDAWNEGALGRQQEHIVVQCQVLARGLMRVGIIALVDEATGYQKDRARDALAKILEAFVAKELQPYVKKFPAEFYEEMFRLRGLPFDPDSVKRPPYFGHLTNDIIYRRLAPGVWKELKAKVRKNSDGRATHQLHRLLTVDVGDPRLKELITRVVTVMQLSDRWADFKIKLDRVVPAYDETLSLPIELEEDSGEGL